LAKLDGLVMWVGGGGGLVRLVDVHAVYRVRRGFFGFRDVRAVDGVSLEVREGRPWH
jgi:ABC-type oligopeptide transport system ATPase subunit